MDLFDLLLYKSVAGDSGGGGVDPESITLRTLNVSQNGTTNAPDGVAYNKVVANVPNTYASADEGKVVSNGALVAQTAHAEVTENGTIDTTLNNSVTVNVPTGSDITLDTLNATANGTYTPQSGHAYSSVVVAIPAVTGVAF